MSNNKVLDPIIDAVIDSLKNGKAPWAKPWAGGAPLPYNVITKKPYRGLNILILGMTRFADPRWGTYKQWAERGCQVKRGEKATAVTFWKFLEVNKAGTGAVGILTGQTDTIPICKTYAIFNAEQCDGVPPLPVTVDPDRPPVSPDETAEGIANAYLTRENIPLGFKADGAWYSPLEDRLNVPPIANFIGTGEYYNTLFHEIAHSTGHGTRLKREGVTDPVKFGSHKYAGEELIAEMTASILTATAGLAQPAVTANTIAYLASWAGRISADRGILLKSASGAQKACDFIMGTNPTADAESAE
jgi:antirestriction protein ArdC